MGDMALLWEWRYHVLVVEEYDDLREALQVAKANQDNGDSALQCIEVWKDGEYRLITGDEAWDLFPPDTPYTPTHTEPAVAEIRIKAPEGQADRSNREALVDRYWDMAEAEAEAARLSSLMGADRVQLRLLAPAT